MAGHIVSSSIRRSFLLKTDLVSAPSLSQAIKRYSQNAQEDDHVIGGRARSTAEEFTRVAKEKAEFVTETAKQTWESTKEAVRGEANDADPESAKNKYKDDKGKYDNMGKD